VNVVAVNHVEGISPDDAVREVLASCVRDREALSLVDSPPGAGKTQLIEQVVALSVVHANDRVYCVTPGADQAADLARRLLNRYSLPRVELLWSISRAQPADLAGRATITSDPTALATGAGVVISTMAKLAMHRDVLGAGAFDLLACDEAYQVTFADFAAIADISGRVVMVGDPGQLGPTVRADITRFEGTPFKVHRPAPTELHRLHSSARVFQLPASRRLLADSVELLQPSFYPQLRFVSIAVAAARMLTLATGGINGIVDEAIDRLAQGHSIVTIVLPGSPPRFDDRDEEVAQVMAAAAQRLLMRGAEWKGRGTLGQQDIGIIDQHVNSGAVVRQHLRDGGLEAVRVNTPEVWQGLEVPVTIVKHPLSVSHIPGSFELDSGRFCVMLSRHLLGCIIVTRASVEDSLQSYIHKCGASPWGADDRAWSGYLAHEKFWKELKRRDRMIGAKV
jgi:hypothetical protein